MNPILNEKVLIELKDYIERQHAFIIFESEPVFVSSSLANEELLLDPNESTLNSFIQARLQADARALLFQYIDKKGVSDADVYKKAGIDRRHFSKIRSNANYKMSKGTLIALSFALELSENETKRLLGSAGYSLSESDVFDLIIQFFLEKGIYNIDEVNEALVHYNFKPLVGVM